MTESKPEPWPANYCKGCAVSTCCYADFCAWEKWIDAKLDLQISIFAKIDLYGAFWARWDADQRDEMPAVQEPGTLF